MRTRKLHFKNTQGHKLAASLDMPLNSPPKAFALFAHCFSCSRNLTAISQISRELNGHGIAVLRFDFTGLGESEGNFSDTNFSSNIQDLIAAARFLEREYLPPRILVGHSLGGAAVLMAAGKIPSCKAVATIAAPSDPAHLAHLFDADRETIERDGVANVLLADRPFRIKKQLLEDLRGVRMLDAIRNLDRALLIFHSPEDKVVPILHAARIYTAARHPKSFVSLDRADHLLSDVNDSRYVGTVIAAWAEKYLDVPEVKKPKKAGDDRLVAVRIGKDRYFTEVEARDHRLVADEPLSSGGGDQGPTPYELLSASLGACTAITLRMYADRKGWDVSEINVFLKHRKIHAEDCEGCPESKPMMDHIEREVELIGRLDDGQRKRMLEIADRCPVHRTLLQSVRITTRLKG
jgi:putative redox protein